MPLHETNSANPYQSPSQVDLRNYRSNRQTQSAEGTSPKTFMIAGVLLGMIAAFWFYFACISMDVKPAAVMVIVWGVLSTYCFWHAFQSKRQRSKSSARPLHKEHIARV